MIDKTPKGCHFIARGDNPGDPGTNHTQAPKGRN